MQSVIKLWGKFNSLIVMRTIFGWVFTTISRSSIFSNTWNFKQCVLLWPLFIIRWLRMGHAIAQTVPSTNPQHWVSGAPLAWLAGEKISGSSQTRSREVSVTVRPRKKCRSLSGKFFHFWQIPSLTGHTWPASFSNAKMCSQANFCVSQFRVYWEKSKSNHTCTCSLKIGANEKVKTWPAKHPSWPAKLIMHRSWWLVYLPDLFWGLVTVVNVLNDL